MKSRFILPFLVLSGAALAAQGADINGGVSVGAAHPIGDLHDKDSYGTNNFLGVQVGGHMDFNITSHHQVRAHVDLVLMPGDRWSSGWKNDYRDIQAGADWVYNFTSPDRGWYSVAGVSINDIRVSYDHQPSGYSNDLSQSGRFGLRGGAGYTFNRAFSVEGTLNQVSVDKNGLDGFGFDTASWINVAAVFRFK